MEDKNREVEKKKHLVHIILVDEPYSMTVAKSYQVLSDFLDKGWTIINTANTDKAIIYIIQK